MINKTFQSKEQNTNFTYHVSEFPNIQDLLQYFKDTPTSKLFSQRDNESFTGTKQFTGTSSFQEALDILNKGWTVQAEKLSKKLPISTTSDQAKQTKPVYSTVGYQASVPRYLQGIPTNMVNSKKQTQKQKIITINKSIAYSAFWSTQAIEAEGIKALQLVQALEHQGFRVKLNVLWVGQSDKEVVVYKVTIKQPDEKLSVSKIAFPLIHPSFIRRIGFRILETDDRIKNKSWTFAYGYPAGEERKAYLKQGEYFIPNKIESLDQTIKEIIYNQK